MSQITLNPESGSKLAHELFKDPRCGAIVIISKDHWPGEYRTDAILDLRLREEGVYPFGSLEEFEKISGSEFIVSPDFENRKIQNEKGIFWDLRLLLDIRKQGYRVFCIADDKAEQKAVPALDAEEKIFGRALYAARFFPKVFIAMLGDKDRMDLFNKDKKSLFSLFREFIEGQDSEALSENMPLFCKVVSKHFGEGGLNSFLARYELQAGYRSKPSIGIYDHALHTPGGGQKYACTMAGALREEAEVTFIANKPVTIGQLEDWYGLELSHCKIKILPLSFYEERKSEFIDQGMAKYTKDNPFEPISEESKRYDVFMNVNMLTLVKPLSPVSVFLCHFPDSQRARHFAVDDYTHIVANSRYTIEWLKKRWNLAPSVHIYPPVDVPGPVLEKELIILSAARFDNSGSKKQLELIDAFVKLRSMAPRETAGWRFVLVGGSFGRNFYLKKVSKKAKTIEGVEVCVNLPIVDLAQLYAKASIFWHACGLDTDVPERIEHFGMATAEAMQNGCVPVVINKGGQREIVEPGVSGFLFDDPKDLCVKTLNLIRDPESLKKLSLAARSRAKRFSRPRFEEETKQFFTKIHQELLEPSLLS